jgi:hypothetical protein
MFAKLVDALVKKGECVAIFPEGTHEKLNAHSTSE